MTIAAVVLAAGSGRRFSESGGQGPKQFASMDGRPMLERVLGAVRAAAVDEVVVVQGAIDLTGHADGVVLVANPRWEEGLATSLAVGIDHARVAGHEAVVVGLADQPGVATEAWTSLAEMPAVPPIAVATYGGHRGNPVRLHAAVWDLLPTTGDRGARDLMRARPDLVVEVPCAGDPRDIDTEEDLRTWT